MKALSFTRERIIPGIFYAMRFLNWCLTPVTLVLAGLALFIWHEVAHLQEPILVTAADARALFPLLAMITSMAVTIHVLIVPAPKWPRAEHDEPR